jgi:hypothetical protein
VELKLSNLPKVTQLERNPDGFIQSGLTPRLLGEEILEGLESGFCWGWGNNTAELKTCLGEWEIDPCCGGHLGRARSQPGRWLRVPGLRKQGYVGCADGFEWEQLRGRLMRDQPVAECRRVGSLGCYENLSVH